MVIASIDIGTNTVLMLIAKIDSRKKLISLVNEYRMPRIGAGLKPGGKILPEKILELMKIIDDYVSIANHVHSEIILATATNAFRIASNASEIVKAIKEKYHLAINIISGEHEAMLSYLGVITGSYIHKDCLVIDIGGGSTEVIIGNKNSILFRKSFPIGAVSAKEKYLINNPPTISQIDEFNLHLNQVFNELEEHRYFEINAVAIAGTPTTLACIKNKIKDYDEEIIEGSFLSTKEVTDFAIELSLLESQAIKLNYGNVMKGREDIILAGTLILAKLMNKLSIREIKVSSKGIRYGAIAYYLQNAEKDK